MVNDLDKRLERLEANMKVLEANLSATLERFRTDHERLRGDMARGQVAMIVAMLVIVGLGLTIHGWATMP